MEVHIARDIGLYLQEVSVSCSYRYSFFFLFCAAFLVLCGCSSGRIAPTSPGGPSSTGPSSPPSTVAYVYVTNQPSSGSPYQIVGYAVDASGQLTAVPGSPFSQNVFSLGASGGYVVAAAATEPEINSYTIGSNGALTMATQFNYQQQTGYASDSGTICGGLGGFVFDRSGQFLYAGVGDINCSNNDAVASFTFNSSNGSVSYLGNTNIGYEASPAVALLGNNAFAYSAFNDECMYGGIMSFERGSNGLLNETPSTITPAQGPPAPSGSTSSGVKQPSYAAGLTAADGSNHVAMAEFPCYAQNGVAATQVQLATYTADANGNLTTADTSVTMPATAISPMDMKMSPSGTLLAVGGIGGVQVFHFNGASSVTSFTNVLTTDNISHMFWDNSNHLYAITLSGGSLGVSPGKLHVFTVTDTAATEAPGSPYTIAAPMSLAVQSEVSAS